ncbi:MAG: U32 family peptidase [Clostridia bacterium]|nr:U32 family peptidase [Clostridia bacterium]
MNAHSIEVLAPAGSYESLTAAVRSGAAAVYLGLSAFNARRAAHNFTEQELTEAVAYCHARGVKVHLALNTLVRDDELDSALAVAEFACSIGIDALIVQDLGLARCIHAAAPTMPLHASTQLSCHTPAGVDFLRDAGFSRVVLAREMSREEIAACAGRGVELEVFVHGALCMSVSGQCYFSAMLGGRSGNRGACAQTCRLPFAPTRDRAQPCAPDEAALSLKDNCLLDHVQDLAALGVASLKIEGRMKRPEYVAAASAVYSAAARGETVDPQTLDALTKVFSRSGFTDGYYTHRLGGTMFGTRRKQDVTAAAGVLGTLARLYDRETPLVAVTMALAVEKDACTLTVSDEDGHRVCITADGAEAALNKPLDPDRAREQLQKTGGTPFFVTATDIAVGEGLTLPASRLNALRREALDALLTVRGKITPIPFDKAAIPPCKRGKTPDAATWIVRLATVEQYSSALREHLVILPLNTPVDTVHALTADGQAIGVEIPRGLFGTEDAVAAALVAAAKAGATAALCGNVGAIALAKRAGLTAIGGFGLNLMNSQALSFCKGVGLDSATLSTELTFPQISALGNTPLACGILLYGRQPLMLTRNCPRQAALGSCAHCHGQGLIDRTGAQFPVICSGGCSEVLNSVPLYWGDRMNEVPRAAFYVFHFTTESTDEVRAVLNAYREGTTSPPSITRGLYRRGVE